MAKPSIPASALTDEATRWFLRLRDSDQVGEEGRQLYARFETWLAADPAHREAYRRCASDWADLAPLASAYAARGHRAGQWHRSRRLRRPLFAAALAGVAAVLCLSLALRLWLPEAGTPQIQQLSSGTTAQTHVLQDGSRIDIDAGTRLSVQVDDERRLAILETGSAYFDIAPDPRRPFELRFPDGTLRVLGTAFEVDGQAGRTRVSVTHGRVEVAGDRDRAVLGAAQSISVNAGELSDVEPVDIAQLADWRAGQLSFVDQPLGDVAARLQRYRAAPIRVSPELLDLRVTMSVQTDDVAAALLALSGVLPVYVYEMPDGLHLSPRKAATPR